MLTFSSATGRTRPSTTSIASANPRGVQVFKLITKGALEEKIDAMITTKAALMDSIVESDDTMFKSFSRKELIELSTF